MHDSPHPPDSSAPVELAHASRRRPRLLFDDSAADRASGGSARDFARGILAVLAIFLTTRLVVWTAAYGGAVIHFRIQFQIEPPWQERTAALKQKIEDENTPEHYAIHRRLSDFNPLTNFDGQHYRSIIVKGYQYAPVRPAQPASERQQNIAFFPLYPLICSALTSVLTPNQAMVLVANTAALFACVLGYFWIRRRIDERAALFFVAAISCFPSACYFSFAYAESVTLLATVSTMMLIDRRSFWAAAVVCGLATASRPTAFGLVPVLMLAYWFNSPKPQRRVAVLAALTVVASAGIAAYAVYLTARFGSPLVYATNFRMGWIPDHDRPDWFEFLTLARVWDQFKYFGRAFVGFPAGLPNLLYPFAWNMPVNFSILFLSVAGLWRVPRSFRPLLLLGPFIFLHSYIAGGGANFGVEPIGRYMAVAVPAFAVLAAWCTREWRAGLRYMLLAGMLFIEAAWAFHFGLDEWSG